MRRARRCVGTIAGAIQMPRGGDPAHSIVMFPFAVSSSSLQPPPLIVPVMFSWESEPTAVIGRSEWMEPKLVRAWTL